MATTDPPPQLDPLALLRSSIASNTLPIPAAEEDPTSSAESNPSLAAASYLIFNTHSAQDGSQHIPLPLSQPTRFVSVAAGTRPLDLRSVYFCWLNKDQNAGTYIAATQTLNEELRQGGKTDTVTNLVFAEKLDLNQWLAGDVGEEESEFIRSLDANKAQRAEARNAAATAKGGEDVEMRDADLADGAAATREQERLRAIYAAERKMGDRNTMLRGAKVQDFSDIRKKYSVLFFGKARGAESAPGVRPAPALTSNPALRPPVKAAQAGRRPEPIILLSPSASSLLRMPNIKSFLEEGVYTTPESGTASNILHLTRTLPHLSPTRPLRFILVDDPSSFRPDYWDRLVAVFTTGQTWQFKNYKWQQPAELFSHALGIYVGWKGELVPDSVKGWGRGVMVAQIDKGGARWRDREVVEEVWRGIEGRMGEMGWGKDGA
ncbi:accessory factor associated with RNA polymerase II [Teratosphaeriaceae sp. CCFEE 6253]|nr:accessory factor associated with RNA polymerase II [Teratosphaeriaceae sp. CCFEE 6253]